MGIDRCRNSMTYNTCSTSGLCLAEGMLFALKYKRQTHAQHRPRHRSQSLTRGIIDDFTSAPMRRLPSPEFPVSLGVESTNDEEDRGIFLNRGNHSIYSRYCHPPVSLAYKLKRWRRYSISPDRYCNNVSFKSNSFGVLADYCGDDVFIAQKPDRACTDFCAYDDFAASLKYLNSVHSRMYHLCCRRRANLLKNIGCFPCTSTCPLYNTCEPLCCPPPHRVNNATRFKTAPRPTEIKPEVRRESFKASQPPPVAHTVTPRSPFKSRSDVSISSAPEVKSASIDSSPQSDSETNTPPPPPTKPVGPRSPFPQTDLINILSTPQSRPGRQNANILSPSQSRTGRQKANILSPSQSRSDRQDANILSQSQSRSARQDANILSPSQSRPARQDANILPPSQSRSAKQDANRLSPSQSRSARQDANILSPSQSRSGRQDANVLSPSQSRSARQDANILSPSQSRSGRKDANVLSPPQARRASLSASLQLETRCPINYPNYYKRLSSFARRQLFSQCSSAARTEDDVIDYGCDVYDKCTSTVEENKPVVVENHTNGTRVVVDTREVSTITTPEMEQRSTQTWEERHKKSTQTAPTLEREEFLKNLSYVSSGFNVSINQRQLLDKWRSLSIPWRRIESSNSDISIQRKSIKPPSSHTITRQTNRNNVQPPPMKKVTFEDKFVNTELVPPKIETVNRATSPKPLTHDKATSVDLKMLDKSTLTDIPIADTASNTDAAPLESKRKKSSAINDLNCFELVTPTLYCPRSCKWNRYADDIFCCKTDCKINPSCAPPFYLPEPCAKRCTQSCTTVCSDTSTCVSPRSQFQSPPSLRHCVKSTSSCRNIYLKC